MNRESVFVVDDDPSVLRSMARLMRSAGFETLTFGSPGELLERLDSNATGCLVLDVSMPGLDGLALQQALTGRGCELPILFVTGHGDIPRSVEAMKGGALDFLTKPVESTILLEAVRQAMQQERERIRELALVSDIRGRLATLTPREREVLEGVIAGQLNKQIAGDLGMAEKTVKVHRARVMKKMKAGSVAELVRLASRVRVRKS